MGGERVYQKPEHASVSCVYFYEFNWLDQKYDSETSLSNIDGMIQSPTSQEKKYCTPELLYNRVYPNKNA